MKVSLPVILLLSFFLFVRCSNVKTKDDTLVATAFGQNLYLSDMKELLKNTGTKDDSLTLIKGFVEKWAKKQALLYLAEKNLSMEIKDVSLELENYRTSLLIYKYQQFYISQHLDTIVSRKEIEEYYNLHNFGLPLEECIVKALYIQLPRSAPNHEIVKSLYCSTKEREIKKLDDYCNKHAFKYDDFKNIWITFSVINKMLPLPVTDSETFLKNNSVIETSDSSFLYFVHIKEFMLPGSPAPLEFAGKFITPIILARRKMDLLNNLENNAFNKELNQNNIEIFYQ